MWKRKYQYFILDWQKRARPHCKGTCIRAFARPMKDCIWAKNMLPMMIPSPTTLPNGRLPLRSCNLGSASTHSLCQILMDRRKANGQQRFPTGFPEAHSGRIRCPRGAITKPCTGIGRWLAGQFRESCMGYLQH